MAVYRTCVLSSFLYDSEKWTLYSREEKRLNSFQVWNLRRILGIKGSDRITNNETLQRAGTPSVYTLLRQRRLCRLGHGSRMQDGRITKDRLYGEIASGKRVQGRPQLRFKDVYKKDMKALDMNVDHEEDVAQDRPRWRQELTHSLTRGVKKLRLASEEQRMRRKNSQQAPSVATPSQCSHCGRDCRFRIGLHSHRRRCPSSNQ